MKRKTVSTGVNNQQKYYHFDARENFHLLFVINNINSFIIIEKSCKTKHQQINSVYWGWESTQNKNGLDLETSVDKYFENIGSINLQSSFYSSRSTQN